MADKENKAVTFEYELEHRLELSVENGRVLFDESKQEIYLTRMSVRPAMEIDRVEMLAHYPAGTEKSVADAVNKILNVSATAVAEKTKQVKPGGTLHSANDIKREKQVNEAQVPNMTVQVISDMLDIPTQVAVDGDGFRVVTKSSDISQFLTFRRSKKIKIFINGKEFSPMKEMEFVKRIFPQIDVVVHLK